MLAMTLIIASTSSLFGQSPSDLYFIGTPKYNPETYETPAGFTKLGAHSVTGQIVNVAVFFAWSRAQDYSLAMLPIRDGENPRTLDLPISELKRLQLIDIEQLVSVKTKEQAQDWFQKNHRNPKVWVIDRSEFYKSSPSLQENDRMILREVRLHPKLLPFTEPVTLTIE